MLSPLWLVPLVGVLASVWSAWARGDPAPPLSDAQINLINSIKGNTWKAGRNFHPSQMAYVRRLVGVDTKQNVEYYNSLHSRTKVKTWSPRVRKELPKDFDSKTKWPVKEFDSRTKWPVKELDSRTKWPVKEFDSRTKWPDCPTIREIRDQGNCASGWALASVASMSDRICVAINESVRLSAEDLISGCCPSAQGGCQGGSPLAAYNAYTYEGIVTGGDYGTQQGCMPYSLPPCEHYVSGPLPNCSKGAVSPTPVTCTRRCIEGYPTSYKDDKHHCYFYIVKGEEDIKYEMYLYGPVATNFSVYEDFALYKSGVYQHVTGDYIGGHAVKILGWGVEAGVDYWLVANSWNTDWGDKGFFKIVRGRNECGIESGALASQPVGHRR